MQVKNIYPTPQKGHFMRTKRILAILLFFFILISTCTSCANTPSTTAAATTTTAQTTTTQITTTTTTTTTQTTTSTTAHSGQDTPADPWAGEYGLHHIVVENISNGQKETYQLGEYYYGMLLSSNTISVTISQGAGVMSYVFEQSITTDITYEVQGDKFIMTCQDAVDLFNDGNPQYRYELSIEEIDNKICFVLTATGKYNIFSYYVIAQ